MMKRSSMRTSHCCCRAASTLDNVRKAGQAAIERVLLGGMFAILAAAVAPASAQQTGKWSFSANISAQTCTLVSPPEVQLPAIQASALRVPGQPTVWAPVTLTLQDCDQNIVQADFTFLPNPDDTMPKYFKIDDTVQNSAKGVAIRLTTKDGTQIDADGSNNTVDRPVAGTGANRGAALDMRLGYVRNGDPISPGVVKGKIEIDMSYN